MPGALFQSTGSFGPKMTSAQQPFTLSASGPTRHSECCTFARNKNFETHMHWSKSNEFNVVY